MKIAQSQMQLGGQHKLDHLQASSTTTIDTPLSQPLSPLHAEVDLSAESLAAQQLDRAGADLRKMLSNHPLWHLVQELVRRITGRDLNVDDVVPMGSVPTSAKVQPPASSAALPPGTPVDGAALLSQAQPAGWRIDTRTVSVEQDTEQTSFTASGKVTTSDGRVIDVGASLDLYRSTLHITSTSSTAFASAQIAPPKQKDPLVINFGAKTTQLSQSKINFDIDNDGRVDSISFPTSGSGFLALDRNGDGAIDDGSELFGTQSGNGFADLAQLDGDGNGWIDENDAAWGKLKVWIKNADGSDRLMSLADLGIGAIGLDSTATDFALQGSAGDSQGQLRSTGLYLKEDGSVGTMQQVDLTA